LGLAVLLAFGALFAQAPPQPAGQAAGRGAAAVRVRYRSLITVYDLQTKSAKTVFTADETWQAPNWTPDGKYLVANMGGDVYRIPINGDKTGKPEKINFSIDLNSSNDHALSFDGKQFALSGSRRSATPAPAPAPPATPPGAPAAAAGRGGGGAQLFVSNIDGSNVRELARGWMHGWSPDGMYVAYVANRQVSNDLYRIRPNGQDDMQLTANPGQDDGPDYSPDGKWIYFCSDRAGNWDIWRIPKDGAGPNDSLAQQITKDELQDWFPHPSPDGKWIYFESYPANITSHGYIGEGMKIRMIPAPGDQPGSAPIQTLATFYGGQGTTNTTGWSPDSKRFAYVVYERLPDPSAAQ
jgi:Tol biopolymer transport system component